MSDCEESGLWNEVIDFLDDNLDDSSNFSQQLEDFEQSLNNDRKYLENQLSSMQNHGKEKDSHIKETIDKLVTDATTLISDINATKQRATSHLVNYETEINDFKMIVDKIENINKTLNYLNFINHLEEESSFIQSSMLIENMDQSVSRFSTLVSLLEQIKDTKCENLKNYTESVVLYWYKIFMSNYSKEMDSTMQSFGWPFIVTSEKQNIPTNAVQFIDKFHVLINLLMKIQLPESYESRADPVFLCTTRHRICLPLQFFLAPFQKRFMFHFYGNKKTNSIEKPEWYFTRLTMWLNDHKDFLQTKLQTFFDKAGHCYVDVLVQFTEGLICLAADKLRLDLNSLLNDSTSDNDQLIAHHIDEALAFHSEIQTILSYLMSFSGVLQVLVEKAIFDRWIAVEKSYAIRRMDSMLETADAWLLHDNNNHDNDRVDGNTNDCKIPHFAELFLILMMTIQDRYHQLPDIDCQSEFSKLQLDLIDDFRIRLVQLRKQLSLTTTTQQHITENPKYAAILNTVAYTSDVLKRWANEPLFVKLNYYKKKLEREVMKKKEEEEEEERMRKIDEGSKGDEDGGDPKLHEKPINLNATTTTTTTTSTSSDAVFEASAAAATTATEDEDEQTIFDGMIELYERMKKDMLVNIMGSIVEEFKNNSKAYRRDRWLALPSHKEFVSLALSNSACHMLKTLKEQLTTMETLLNSSLFSVLWRDVVEALDQYIFENIICANHFNEGGAMQLNFDMTRNLFTLFSCYTNKPENHFKCVKEACHVLTLASGSALLIRDVLKRALHPTESKIEVSDPIAALQDIGIYKLEPERVEYLLSLRIDLYH